MRLIDRHVLACVCLSGIGAIAPAVPAQREKLSVQDVSQIASEALRVITPPNDRLSGISVATRGIAFDMRGTLAAFGATAATDTAMSLGRSVANVTHA